MDRQNLISGRVTRIGYYRDTLPQLVITISKKEAIALMWLDGVRQPFLLSIHGDTYLAGIRTTSKSQHVNICPDLHDRNGNLIRLSDLLLSRNIQQKTTIELNWEGDNRVLSL